ncbi:SH3 domain-containing protein [Loktanella sp. SALINAS62]|uniref:SH3 domain-containing protein n=1 Tax=Loktanella sp. SALINAS62 TaxID=2706124 RepID=UPI0020117C71|nr:SH3 domain-containing protein [Loktanella sp. SALINAS62]
MSGASTVVRGVGSDDLLKLRAGPGLGYAVIVGIPDGTALTRRDCVTELGQRWCNVALRDHRSLTGYVAEDYLQQR